MEAIECKQKIVEWVEPLAIARARFAHRCWLLASVK